MLLDNMVYCPMCDEYFSDSEYLRTVFEDEKQLWLANMVTHYRHNHITSWNKCWGYGGGRYRNKWFGNYDNEKREVNERAKRQILRKCKSYLNANGFTSADFDALKSTDYKTMELAEKLLV